MNSSELDANAISKERIIWTHHGGDFHPRFNTSRTLRCFARHQRMQDYIEKSKIEHILLPVIQKQ